MTTIQMIESLIKAGYEVEYYKRKDGGYRITRINRERFTGSSGNIKARTLLGVKLSERRERSLKKLTTPKGKGSYNKRRKEKLDESTRKQIQKLQRQYRKKGTKEGLPTIRNYRYILKTKGKAEADRLLSQASKRIQGLAYTENVDALLMRISADLNKKTDSLMENIYIKIQSIKENFKEAWISEVYAVIYDWERNIITSEEAHRKISLIIG